MDLLRVFPFLVGIATFGVTVFFVISGYLVTQSWMKHQNALIFLAHRLLRIIPGLWTCIIFVVFIGAVFSTLQVKPFLFHSQVLEYIVGNIFFKNILTLPGVFETNPSGGIVSGTLWTLPIELTCYLWVFVIGVVMTITPRRLRKPWFFILMACLSLVITTLHGENINIFQATVASQSLPLYYAAFICGAILYQLRSFVIVHWSIPTTILLLVVAMKSPSIVYILVFSWFLINTVHHVSRVWPEPPRWPDLSYGIYLFGFPIQQALIAKFPQWSGWENLGISLILTILVAGFSWYFIESPALNIKKYLKN